MSCAASSTRQLRPGLSYRPPLRLLQNLYSTAVECAQCKDTLQKQWPCCRHANELRSKLDQATQARTELQTAVEALLKHNRPEDAAQVEEAITSGQECGSALDDDVALAKQALQRWQLVTSTEVKLARAVSEGNSILGLSRAIQVRLHWLHKQFPTVLNSQIQNLLLQGYDRSLSQCLIGMQPRTC